MRHAGDGVHGHRLRGLIVVLWRAGLRICEALALAEADLDPRRGSLLVRRGKGGRRREVGMDDWAWEQLQPWLQVRVELPVGPLLCIVNGPTRGRPWTAGAARSNCDASPARPGCAALRAAPAAPRARRRNGPRRRAADRHPTPARAHQPRHHLDLPQASTTPRSSTPSTPAVRRWSPSTARSRTDAATSGGEAGDFPAADHRRGRRPPTNRAASGLGDAPFIARERLSPARRVGRSLGTRRERPEAVSACARSATTSGRLGSGSRRHARHEEGACLVRPYAEAARATFRSLAPTAPPSYVRTLFEG